MHIYSHKTCQISNNTLNMTLSHFLSSQNEPFVAFKRTDLANGKPLVGNERFEGYCIDMIVAVAHRINFTFEIRELQSKAYGSLLDNGSWTGMIGQILNGVRNERLGHTMAYL